MDLDNNKQVYQENVYQYIQIASIVVLVYDHFITLDEEVKYIWSKASRKISIAFLFLRYVGLAVMLTVYGLLCFFHVIGQPEKVPGGTLTGAVTADALMMAMVFYIALLFLWRIYALYERNLRLVVGLLIIGTLIMSTSVAMLLRAKASTTSLIQKKTYYSASWLGLLLWDILICILTIVKTHRTHLANNLLSRQSQTPMISIIFRDGISYFLILTSITLSNLLTNYLAPYTLQGCLSIFDICMSINLLCRMITNVIKGFDPSEEMISRSSKQPGATVAIKHMPKSGIGSKISTFQAAENIELLDV